MVYNMLPVAAQGAADLNGLRPHAAGPKVSEELGVNYEKSQDVARNSGHLRRSWGLVDGCWLLLVAVGCWLLVAGSWLLVVVFGCCSSLLAVGGCAWLLVVCYFWLLFMAVVGRWVLVVGWASCVLLGTGCRLLVLYSTI